MSCSEGCILRVVYCYALQVYSKGLVRNKLLLLFTAVAFSLGGSSPYTSNK